MSTEIQINPETQEVTAVWKGEPGRSSLFQAMAPGNCRDANQLDRDEIVAVMMCAKSNPYPISLNSNGFGGASFTTRYRDQFVLALSEVKENGGADYYLTEQGLTLGELREGMVYLCGDGCNAPHDSYLRAAAQWKEERRKAIEEYMALGLEGDCNEMSLAFIQDSIKAAQERIEQGVANE